MSLLERVRKHEAKVVVIGAGYVGLPLSVEVARSGFSVIAFDKVESKCRSILAGKSYIKDISDEELAPLVKSGKLHATSDAAALGQADVIIICVPTPLNKTGDPDNSFIIDAAAQIVPRLHPGQLIILESTTFPGFTREVLLPQLQATGLVVGKDFFLAFSPERVDPGNATYHTKNTPKVIGGTTPACLEAVKAMYGEIIDRVIPVSSTDAAEMVKLLENTFRAVNIGLVNEVAIMCGKLGLDTWEVIDAAATKPFGFMPFYPGPGLGGHCIPVDPQYLSWKLKTLKYHARFIELAGEVNSAMPDVVVQRVSDALNDRRIPLNGARVLLLGVSYKKDVDDVRESPALDIISGLKDRGAHVSYHDPHVERILTEHGKPMTSVPLARLEDYECVVIVTDHSTIDFNKVVAAARLVVDTRNATKGLRRDYPGRIVTL